MADLVMLAHAAFVLFVVGGLAATWWGLATGRRFARSPLFRGIHLACIAVVVAESLAGIMCPLTVWEDALRGGGTEKGFIERWVHAWLFWDWPAWVFTSTYVGFGLLVAATWIAWPPRRR